MEFKEIYNELTHIEIPPDSKQEQINKNSFSHSSIEWITLPRILIKIGDEAFYACQNLSKIDIQTNSKLKFIGRHAFIYTFFNSFYVPSNVIHIVQNAFQYREIRLIEFEENTKMQIIDENMFSRLRNDIIMIPANQKIKFK